MMIQSEYDETELLDGIRVIDLKQYAYCPRILYYQMVLPDVRPTTYKMEAGITAHKQEEKREKRRSLRSYGLSEGEQLFNVGVKSDVLGLSGEIDMVIETADEIIPVDYKLAKKEGAHFRLQLMAYGAILSEQTPKPIKRGFLYLIPSRKVVEVKFTPHLRRKLTRCLDEIGTIINDQQIPMATKKRGRCVDCEFRRFCNDVL